MLPLACQLYYLYYAGPLFCILGCNNILLTKFCQCHWTLLLYYYLELQYPVNALRVLSQVDVGLYLYHWK